MRIISIEPVIKSFQVLIEGLAYKENKHDEGYNKIKEKPQICAGLFDCDINGRVLSALRIEKKYGQYKEAESVGWIQMGSSFFYQHFGKEQTSQIKRICKRLCKQWSKNEK